MDNNVIHIETDNLLKIKNLGNSVSEKVTSAYGKINSVANSTGWKCPEKKNVTNSLSELAKGTQKTGLAAINFAFEASSASTRFQDCVNRAGKTYGFTFASPEMWKVVNDSLGETVINPIGPKTLGFIDKIINSWTKKVNPNQLQGTTQELYQSLISAGIVVAPISLITVVSIWDAISSSITNTNNTGKTQGNSNPNSSTTNNKGRAPKYNIPDYAKKNVEPDENGIYGPIVYWRDGINYGSVSYYNDPDTKTQLSCTYYTLRKLNERGISFPCTGGPGSGKDWISHFDTESGLPYSKDGVNSLSVLFDKNGLPQDNIVVSSTNAWSRIDGVEYGHVFLIDHAYKDENGQIWCKYSDNNPDIPNLNDSNDSKPRRLEELMEEQNIIGAAILGATDAVY